MPDHIYRRASVGVPYSCEVFSHSRIRSTTQPLQNVLTASPLPGQLLLLVPTNVVRRLHATLSVPATSKPYGPPLRPRFRISSGEGSGSVQDQVQDQDQAQFRISSGSGSGSVQDQVQAQFRIRFRLSSGSDQDQFRIRISS